MIKAVIKFAAMIMGIYLCQESSRYGGIYLGHIQGAQLCKIVYPVIGNLHISHADPYFYLVDLHRYISLFLIIFIIGQLIKKELLSQIISLPSIIILFILFIQIYMYKKPYISDEASYINLIRETLSSDFIHIWLALALLIYQAVTAFQDYLNWNRENTKIK